MRLVSPKSSTFDTRIGDQDVPGFEVAVNDSPRVHRDERVGGLRTISKRQFNRQRTALQFLGERLTSTYSITR